MRPSRRQKAARLNSNVRCMMDKIAEKTCFIYVLRLNFERWYIGCTTNFDQRMKSHFGKGGAVATKECPPIFIHKVFMLDDYRIRTTPARQVAEVLVANSYAIRYGYEKVRGAKHGKGWQDLPSKNNLRDIKRFQKWKTIDYGQELMSNLVEVDPKTLLSDKTLNKIENLTRK